MKYEERASGETSDERLAERLSESPHRRAQRVARRIVRAEDAARIRRALGMEESPMALRGRTVTFHGAFADKADAVRKERAVGGFIVPKTIRGHRRYLVMTRHNPREHRPRVRIAGRLLTLGRRSPWKGKVRRVNPERGAAWGLYLLGALVFFGLARAKRAAAGSDSAGRGLITDQFGSRYDPAELPAVGGTRAVSVFDNGDGTYSVNYASGGTRTIDTAGIVIRSSPR